MAFKIMARTILELGAELISSDGVALYELIKNSVDAGSKRVRINVTVKVLRSHFDLILAAVSDGSSEIPKVRRRVLAVVDGISGLDASTKQQALKLAKTAEDTDELVADLWAWYDENGYIEIVDTGHGMSLDDLDKVYLTIGTRSRREQRDEARRAGSDRAPLGEKGVGRLSTMRLGDQLEVSTSRSGDTYLNALHIDWSMFSHESDALLEQVDVQPRRSSPKMDPKKSGTTVRIRRLKDDWTVEKLKAIAGEEFARLVDPFESSTANDLIRLKFNGDPVEIPEIDRKILDLAHGSMSASFDVAETEAALSGEVRYRVRDRSRTFSLNTTELVSVCKVAKDLLIDVGPFKVEMWWFNRRLITNVAGIGTQAEIRAEIGRWSGGLMLFRDGYRVNPYGGGSDDWLELDKRAFASSGYKLNRQQVVGRVRISWKNGGLQDQTNREGLTDTPQKKALVRILQHLVLVQFKQFIDAEDRAARIQERTTIENIELKIESAEDAVKAKLGEINQLLPRENRHLVSEALRIIKELTGYLNEAKALSDEVANDRAQLVHLAGVGLMIEFVMHELERTTSATLRTLSDIDRSSLQKGDAAAISVLAEQLRTIGKRVANLDPMSTARRQVKETFDVGATLREVVEGHTGKMRRHGIVIDGSYSEAGPWKVKAVRGMFLQIVENLLSNSFYWVLQQRNIQPELTPTITINVDPQDQSVTVTDNGPGVPPDIASEIFQPFVTRRPAGEGHGLGLFISREVAHYHGWTLDLERTSTIRPGRYNTFVLDLSGQ